MEYIKLAGPPGTGKTTKLLAIVNGLLNNGTDPERICMTSFTRAAAYEARDRACVKFGLSPERFPYFRTIHSLCFRNQNDLNLMKTKDWLNVAQSAGIPITVATGPEMQSSLTGGNLGDIFLSIHNLARVRQEPLKETFSNIESFIWVDWPQLVRFIAILNNYKRDFNKVDFTDLLHDYVVMGEPLDIDYMIVDEFQDLSSLQIECVERLGANAKTMWIAGDDDQAIHTWAGAAPERFIDYKAKQIVLDQSYRIPNSVHKVANGILSKLSKRLEKEYKPREEEGTVTRLDSLSFWKPKEDESYLLLVRNRYFAEMFEKECIERGLPYSSKISTIIREGVINVAKNWTKLLAGEQLLGEQCKEIYKLMRGTERVSRGYKTVMEEVDDSEPLDLFDLRDQYGLLTDKPWNIALNALTNYEKDYIERLEKSGTLFTNISIEISTIHHAKGREADNVLLCTDMSLKTHQAFDQNMDAEHRVWYVAVTRAKKNLIILEPHTKRFYEL